MHRDGKSAKQRKGARSRGEGGRASPWHVEAIVPAKRDADRLFKRLPAEARAVAIDQCRNLAWFPDKKPTVDGKMLDLNFEHVKGEIFYRLRVDDDSFGSHSLRVFFYPQKGAITRGLADRAGTIWIVGLAWREDAYKKHMLARCRRRVTEIVGR